MIFNLPILDKYYYDARDRENKFHELLISFTHSWYECGKRILSEKENTVYIESPFEIDNYDEKAQKYVNVTISNHEKSLKYIKSHQDLCIMYYQEPYSFFLKQIDIIRNLCPHTIYNDIRNNSKQVEIYEKIYDKNHDYMGEECYNFELCEKQIPEYGISIIFTKCIDDDKALDVYEKNRNKDNICYGNIKYDNKWYVFYVYLIKPQFKLKTSINLSEYDKCIVPEISENNNNDDMKSITLKSTVKSFDDRLIEACYVFIYKFSQLELGLKCLNTGNITKKQFRELFEQFFSNFDKGYNWETGSFIITKFMKIGFITKKHDTKYDINREYPRLIENLYMDESNMIEYKK